MGLLTIAFLANAVLIEPLGWPISGAILFFAAFALGSRHVIRDAVIAIALSFGSWYLFDLGLGVNLPVGVLTESCDGRDQRLPQRLRDRAGAGASHLGIRRSHPRHRHRRAAGHWSGDGRRPVAAGYVQPGPGQRVRHVGGIYYGAMYGGSTTSILLNTPARARPS